MKNRIFLKLVLTAVGLFMSMRAIAVPIDANLIITASVELDALSYVDPEATATEEYIVVSGGATSTSSSAPVSASLTDLGDELQVSLGATTDSAYIYSALYSNITLDIENMSSDTIFDVIVNSFYNLSVQAYGVDAVSDAVVEFNSPTIDEYIGADSYFGPFSEGSTGSAGLLLTLNPLTSISLAGRLDVSGETYDLDSSFNSSGLLNISVASVTAKPAVTPVPEPSVLALLAIGLAGLGFSQRYKS